MLKITKLINIDAFFSAFESIFDPNYKFDGERHNFWEMVYVADGCIGVAEDDRIYKLSSGEAIFHKPMEFHRIWSSDGTAPRVIFLTFSASGGNFELLGNGVFKISAELEQIITESLSAAVYCREIDDPIKNQLAAVNLEKLLLKLMEAQLPESRQQKTKGTANYKLIIRVMNENIGKSISCEELAELCGLGLSNLKKTFRRYAGTGVMEYFNHLKIMRAMEMIAAGASMATISESLGFSSPNYFSEAFKKHCGITPTQYKRKFVTDVGGILL